VVDDLLRRGILGRHRPGEQQGAEHQGTGEQKR
jgi:hypothetical protein